MEQTNSQSRQVRIRFQYTEEEFVRGVRYYLRKSHLISWVQLVIAALAFFAATILTVVFQRLTFLNTLVMVFVVLLAGYGSYLYFIQPRRVFRKEPALSKPFQYCFSPEDIARQDEAGAGLYDWNVKKLWRGAEFYYLFTDKDGYTMLPRRAFLSEEQQLIFEGLVLEAGPEVKIKNFD